jgi:histidine triad (HIT) family protein
VLSARGSNPAASGPPKELRSISLRPEASSGPSTSPLDLRERLMSDGCVFCGIVRRTQPASIVWEDDLTMAFVDLRQFHAGHTLVIPRQHICDVRELDQTTGAALMASVIRITRAVATAFPNQGLSLWHSIGEAADQEVPHLHIHVHPRMLDDHLLQVYPSAPALPDKPTRDSYAAALRSHLD